MRKIFLTFILATLFLSNQNVSAHFIEGDNSISAQMHITPTDNPIAGEESILTFQIHDSTQSFKKEDCNCKYSVHQNGEEIYSQVLNLDGLESSSNEIKFLFTFPSMGTYQIMLIGESKLPHQFESFNLEYVVQVDQVVSQKTGSNFHKNALLPCLACGAMIGGVLIARRKLSPSKK